ncbi:hypothetical protein Hbl1158_11960 [Halobaculum sp. CBA1158]|uniref:hypothetical protein n=1 Tax=Halobaculum sp. CBA1158 TaxID=2904243 RepID=UPI001F48F814|nr:hypothetical protein [Halobaculum sp. CBA1158]UIO99240.1 hypothetical protein Hbl1158_11960 [Halobaculum sp. CBA1158]
MYRRTVLAAATATLAGCGLAPSPPTTDGYPETPPNAFFAFEWDADGPAYEVTFARGNRLAADNTGRLLVRVDGGAPGGDAVATPWVGAVDGVGGDDLGDPRREFPLSPGATLRVPVESPGTVRVVWVAPDGDSSRAVGRWRRESQSAATATGDGSTAGTPTGGTATATPGGEGS